MTLWNFAKRKGYLPRDRSTEADHMETIKFRTGSVGIYAPDALQKALRSAPENVKPCLAIAAFAGLRTAEIARLAWEDIGSDYITVQADKAKTGQRRLVPILPALRSFLPEEGEGKVSPFANDTHLSRALSDAFRNVKAAPVKNGLRHSFCSYRLAAVKSAPQVALEAGNSPQVIFQSYRELVTEADAAAWFAVSPSMGENTVSFSEVAA
jgi:integrase